MSEQKIPEQDLSDPSQFERIAKAYEHKKLLVPVIICLALDGLALLFHFGFLWGFFDSRFFSLEHANGFAEWVQYGKYVLMMRLFWVWRSFTPSVMHWAWIAALGLLLIADLARLHKKVGALFLDPMNGELYVLGALSLLFVSILAYGYVKSEVLFRRFSLKFGIFFAVWAVVVIGFEFWHNQVESDPQGGFVWIRFIGAVKNWGVTLLLTGALGYLSYLLNSKYIKPMLGRDANIHFVDPDAEESDMDAYPYAKLFKRD